MLKTLPFFLFALILTTQNVSASILRSFEDEAQLLKKEEKPKCELLLDGKSVAASANPNLNHQLRVQISAETFVNAIKQQGEGLEYKSDRMLYMLEYLQEIPELVSSIKSVLEKSIKGFERQGCTSAAYAEKGLNDEDGVIYQIEHADGKLSFVVLSRVVDSVSGFNEEAFAESDLTVNPQAAGEAQDLSAIRIEVVSQSDEGLYLGNEFVLMPNKNSRILRAPIVKSDQEWKELLALRLHFAKERNARVNPSHQYSVEFMKEIPEEK